VRPVLRLRGHGVDVGVEEHGGEGRVGAPPSEEEQRLGLARVKWSVVVWRLSEAA
jgi:hypothetical protein